MAVTKIGRYDVVRLLSKGSRAETYLAEDRPGGRRLAIKVLSLGADAEGFLEDARKIAALSHPGIAECQVGLHDGDPFVATEYMSGSNLSDWLKQKPPLPARLLVIDGIAEALNHAHEQGVVHHGIKPSNVQVLPDGTGRLMDFGAPPAPSAISGPGVGYFAPEVLQGGASTAKSDIYSAGLLFYEILAGENPFARGTPKASAEAVLNDQPPHLGERRKDVHRDLADAIMVCLEKDPDWRPKDLAYILELVRKLGGGASKSAAKGASRPAAGGPPALSSFTQKGGGGAPSRLPLIAGGAVALLVAGGAGWWFFLRPTTAPKQSPQSAGAPTPTPTPTPSPTPTPEAPANDPLALPSGAPAGRPSPQVATRPIAPSPGPVGTLATPPPPAPTTTLAAAPTGRVEVPVARVSPTLAPAPVQTPEVAVPATTTMPAAPVAPSVPPVLKTLTPPSVKRNATGILDLRGSGLRGDLQVRILHGREVPTGIRVVRQRFVSDGLLQVAIFVDAAASPGAYTISLADPSGYTTTSLRFDVAK